MRPVLGHLRCPRCQGSQYRVSSFDVKHGNPFGAKCIFCKADMVSGSTVCSLINKVNAAQVNIHQ
nr:MULTISPECIES: cold-shock protein [Mangrovibacter]